MFWGPSDGLRQVLSTRHAALVLKDWCHTVMAQGALGAGHVDCGGLPLRRSGGYRLPLGRHWRARLIEATCCGQWAVGPTRHAGAACG